MTTEFLVNYNIGSQFQISFEVEFFFFLEGYKIQPDKI